MLNNLVDEFKCCCLNFVYLFLMCQWDQLDSVYQFNWNFSNLEVSCRIFFAFFYHF